MTLFFFVIDTATTEIYTYLHTLSLHDALPIWLYAAYFASVGLNSRQCEKRERQPAVTCQFSPLMSWITAEPCQDSSVGTTKPTPLPERVGAKAITCSGPSWRK